MTIVPRPAAAEGFDNSMPSIDFILGRAVLEASVSETLNSSGTELSL